MILEVLRIIKDYQSHNGNTYTLVHFRDPLDNKFYLTYICPSHRNWNHWEKCLKKGKFLKNVHTYKDNIINADSIPEPLTKKKKDLYIDSIKRSKMTPEENREYYHKIGIYI